jgi:hypothetical protein
MSKMNKIQPALAIVALLSISTGLFAQENKPLGRINDHWRVTGELQTSYEVWDYFRPATPSLTSSYDLWEVRARLGLQFTSAYVDALVQGQYTGLYGLPSNAVAPPPIGALGLGGAYTSANNGSTSPDAVFLRQAYLNFKLSSLGLTGASLKLGRFEFADGMEYKSNNEKFDGIKKNRIAQRLLGSNAVYVQRTFDGFSSVYDNADFNVTATGVRPTQGGFNVQGQDEISKINVFYGALTAKKNVLLPNTEGRLFYTYYHDDRAIAAVDNRPAAKSPLLNQQPLALHTVGAHLLTLQNVGANSIDGLLWGAYQFGDWTNQQQSAWAFDAELGYQRTDLPLKPWLRAVYYTSSGDNNADDGHHNTFFSMLPSGRLYAKFPFYNLMNVQDAFVEFIVSPTDNTKITIDFHHLALANSNDLLYGGLGATSKSGVGTFGFNGKPSGGSSTIGQLLDVTLMYNINKDIFARLYYAHAFGGSVIENNYAAKTNADTAWIELNAAF